MKSAYSIQSIRTEADYQYALSLVAPYFDNEPELDSDAGAHFEAMVTLIEALEAKHYPIAPPDPVQAIKFRGQLIGVAPSLDEFDHLLTKLRRVRRLGGMRFGHLGRLVGEQ